MYNLGDAFGPGYSRLAYARLPSANQALRFPIADYKTQLSLEIGIDGFSQNIVALMFCFFKIKLKEQGKI